MKLVILLAAGLVFIVLITAVSAGRYEIAVGRSPIIYRIDRLTGTVETCNPMIAYFGAIKELDEAVEQPSWCKPSFIRVN